MEQVKERMFYRTQWIIRRYPDQAHFEKGIPAPVIDAEGKPRDAISIVEGNTLLNEGIQALLDRICGLATPTYWDAGNSRIGVGDNSAAAANSQTGLQAANNKAWANMANGYPSRSNQTVTWQASFDANTANFGWQEFTVVNAANDSGNNLNRVVSNQGTKTAGQVWTVSVQVTLS
jgi:hypothetical protein